MNEQERVREEDELRRQIFGVPKNKDEEAVEVEAAKVSEEVLKELTKEADEINAAALKVAEAELEYQNARLEQEALHTRLCDLKRAREKALDEFRRIVNPESMPF